MGRLQQPHLADNIGAGATTTYTWDDAHRLTSATLALGANTAIAAWTYDADKRVSKITRNQTGQHVWTDFTWDNASRLTKIKHNSYWGLFQRAERVVHLGFRRIGRVSCVLPWLSLKSIR